MKITGVVAALILIQSLAFGDVTFKSSVDKTALKPEESLTLTIQVQANTQNLPAPSIPTFENLSVIGSSQSSGFSVSNGAVSSNARYILVLRPSKAGKAHIGSSSITIDAQTFSTDPIIVTVQAAKSLPKPAKLPKLKKDKGKYNYI